MSQQPSKTPMAPLIFEAKVRPFLLSLSYRTTERKYISPIAYTLKFKIGIMDVLRIFREPDNWAGENEYKYRAECVAPLDADCIKNGLISVYIDTSQHLPADLKAWILDA